jgi:flagella synthesis protein FlgN
VSRSDRAGALRRLALGIVEDLQAYRALQVLLDAQFDAAVRHQTSRLVELAEQIMQACTRLDAHREERCALALMLAGPQARIADVFALLQGKARGMLEDHWTALEVCVTDCKRLARRNSQLMADQYTIMQRVIHGEEAAYAPA